MSANDTTSVIVYLQWSNEDFAFEIEIPSPTNADGAMKGDGPAKFTGLSLMNAVHSLTKVPVDRQKLLIAKSKRNSNSIQLWKGILKKDFDFASALARRDVAADGPKAEPIELSVTLMGTADVLAPNNNKTKFLEDMTSAEKKAAEQREVEKCMENVSAMIPALQVRPMERQPRDEKNYYDEHDEDRAYDRIVHGFSQLRIDALLRQQHNPPNRSLQEGDPKALPPPPKLLGRVVMTMGLEMQRAYVNDLAVLKEDGTLVSGLDDGHIHMWKHCRKVNDLVHQSAGGTGIFDAFPGVDSVLALDNSRGSSPAAFATAGRGCIRVWNSEGESLLGRSSPLPYASPTGLIRIPISASSNGDAGNSILCLAARFLVAPPRSRRPRLVPQDNAGRRRLQEIETSESMVVEDLTKLSMSIQILFVDTTTSNSKPGSGTKNETFGKHPSKENPTLRSLFLNAPNPVTAMASWKDGNSTFLVVGDSKGGIMFWKISLATSSSNELIKSSVRGSRSASALHGARTAGSNQSQSTSNAPSSSVPRMSCLKLKYVKIASLEDPTESRSAIACLKYVEETKQLYVSTKEIPPTSLSSSTFDDTSLRDVPAICFPLKQPQAVHCISVDAILNKRNHDPLDFTLDGHNDVVQSILPLPNGDIVTAGGKLDATTQVWSWSQIRGAAQRITEQDVGNDKRGYGFLEVTPPPVLTEAGGSTNLAGYVFGAQLLQDFKSRSSHSRNDAGNGKSNVGNAFAVAVAQYNVVKIVI